MSVSRKAELVELVKAGFADALVSEGFVADAGVDPESGGWFTASEEVVPSVTSVVGVGFEYMRYGVVAAEGYVGIQSKAANEVLASMPVAAWLDRDTEESLRFSFIEWVGFGELCTPPRMRLVERLSERGHVDETVGWLMGFVSGSGAGWFADRDSLDKLIVLAKTPNRGTIDNIDPLRFREVVALCVVSGRFDDAAALVGWYLARGKFNVMDSLVRVSAFDEALAERYPDYARARTSRAGS